MAVCKRWRYYSLADIAGSQLKYNQRGNPKPGEESKNGVKCLNHD